jgi:hypothetical protein
LFASKIEIEEKIYKEILYTIFPYKQTIKVWCDTNDLYFLNDISKVKILNNINDADILIIEHELKDKKYKNKIIFVRNYHLLKMYKSFVIGGFYWQKGRPNILFIRKNIDKFNIKLFNGLENFIEDEF